MLACDIIERLIDFAGADVGDRSQRQARRAMWDAWREFPGLHRWTYHYTHGRVELVASYSTGTVTYDNSTRTVTLSNGTWPAWAADGSIRINDVVSEVAQRIGDTQLLLSPTVNPGVDFSTDVGYTLFQDQYLLPADFLAMDCSIAETWFGELEYVHPTAWLWSQRTALRIGPPQYYTLMPARYLPGRYALYFWPTPDRAQTMDFIYQRRLRALKYDNVTAGKVNLGMGVAGTGTNFMPDMVGSYIRVSANDKVPSNLDGSNPFAVESKITAVASATSLNTADNYTGTLNGVGYIIADPLDIEDGVMANAFIRQSILHMAKDLRMKDRQQIEGEAMEALIRAKEHDARNFSAQKAGPGGYRRANRRYMATGPDEP
jgi:hypothetical protein